jgi:hypothetical protein
VIEVELKKQMKLAARKSHYYALGRMMAFIVCQMKDLEVVVREMRNKFGEDPESVPEEVLTGVAGKATECAIPLFQVCHSLKLYQQAFGEYPEWVRFTPIGKTPEEVADFVDKMTHHFFEMNKALGKSDKGENLLSIAFGDEFTKMAETTKLKGEQ